MAYLRYDFHSNTKLEPLSNATVGVYARLISYASANLTDGYIPVSVARKWDRNRAHINALQAAGLITDAVTFVSQNGPKRDADPVTNVTDGYMLVNYLDHNPSKAEVEGKRAIKRQNEAARRAAKRHKTDARGDVTEPPRGHLREVIQPIEEPHSASSTAVASNETAQYIHVDDWSNPAGTRPLLAQRRTA